MSLPKCTYCGGSKWLEGPSGGMSTNILCANEDCRHWFNYTPGMAFDDLHNQEKTAKQRHEEYEANKLAIIAHPGKIRQEGIDIFNNGGSAGDCMKENAYGGYAAANDCVLRLTGFIDTMQKYYQNRDLDLTARLLHATNQLTYPFKDK